MQVSGKCHCGSVSFTAQVDPSKVLACHCSDCQQFSGAPFRAVLPTPVADISIHGEVKQYIKVAESGNRRAQAFCPECGTQLYAADAENPKVLNIRLGCVNERAQLAPRAQLWGASAMPWLPQLTGVPMHSKGSSSPLMNSNPTAASGSAA
jgi:hypothetical protein